MKKTSILFGILILIFVWQIRAHESKSNVNLVAKWLQLQHRLIRSTKGVQHVAYSRHFAYTSIAVYESVVPGDSQYKSLIGQLQDLNNLPLARVNSNFCSPASANAAFAEMLRYFYKGNILSSSIDSLEKANTALFMADGFSEDQIKKSGYYGKSVAQAIIAWTEKDGSINAAKNYTVQAGDGKWVATPPSFGAPAVPYWGNNRTIIKSSIDVNINAPIAFSNNTSSDFYAMVKELYTTTQQLTPEQKNIAWFWDDSPNGKFLTVFGHWSCILGNIIQQKNLSLIQSAEAFTKMSIVQHDAAIACWREKYKHALLRPISYIQKYMDAAWQPVISTPPHPEFPAAHATLSFAAATALTQIFGNDIAFTDHTYDDVGMAPRNFTSFFEAAHEAGISRLYGGIHYKPSIEVGNTLGTQVAERILTNLQFKKTGKHVN